MSTLLCCIAAIGLHLGSVHIPDNNFNNTNPGVYAELDSHIVIGGYRNSYNRDSFYLGYNSRYTAWGNVVPSVTIGAITGYKNKVMLAAVPAISYKVTEHVELKLSYIPKIEKGGSQVLHLSTEWRF